MYAADISHCSDQATACTTGVEFLVGIGHSFRYGVRTVPGITRIPKAGLADGFDGACPNFLYISEQILSPPHGNFEGQNKVLETSIITIN